MTISVEISLYPLTEAYEAPVIDFIGRLKQHEALRIHTNALSTQISGPYEAVMEALRTEIKTTFDGSGTYSMVLKMLNTEVTPGATVEI